MGKKSKSSSKTEEKTSKSAGTLPFGGASLDPTLSSLFAQSVCLFYVQLMNFELTFYRLVLCKPP